MQIHELNNYSGELNNSAYLAVDNGNDTGKVSYSKLFLQTENEIVNLRETLNGRIDNIIAGGDAPSAAEIVDARRGENGVNYPSLGDAIRGQYEELNNAIDEIETVARVDRSYSFDNVGFINTSGNVDTNPSATHTDFISLTGVQSIHYKAFLNNTGCGLAFFDANGSFVSSISIVGGTTSDGSTVVITDAIRNSAATFVVSHYNNGWVPECSITVRDNTFLKRIEYLEDTYLSKDTMELDIGLNKFNKDAAITGKEVYADGTFATESASAISDYIPVHGASHIYIKNLPTYSVYGMGNRYAFFYDSSKNPVGSLVYMEIDSPTFSVAVPNNAYYFVFSIYQRVNPADLPIDFSSVMFTLEPTDMPFEPYTEYIVGIDGYKIPTGSGVGSLGASGLKVVIFGDSITETASMNDDGSNYVEGTRHNWPEFANEYLSWGSFKNYAQTGARYKDNPAALYRQSVSNQIALALADSNNDDADIIIISLGTNDGTNNLGSYEMAMSKSTRGALDRSNLYEALRYAYWTLRDKYKNAVCFAAIPIQRADIEPPTALYEAIEKMAHRYDFIVIDGAYQSGIVRENNTWGAAGNDLEDGLHPNTVGQIKMAKLYSDVILRNYLWRK